MNDLIERDNRGGIGPNGRFIAAVAAAAIASAACIHVLPAFALFFSVPLFTVYLASGNRAFVVSVFFAFFLDASITLATLFFSVPDATSGDYSIALLQSAILFLPALFLLLPGTLRMRYRVSLTGIVASAAWLALFFGTDTGVQLAAMMREIAGETATMLYSMIPEGYERTAFQAMLDPESFYGLLMKVFSYSFMPLCVVLYATGYAIASLVASIIRRKPAIRFSAKHFYAEYFLFIPLVCGMSGVIAGKLFDTGKLDAVFWNVFILSGLFFVLQGFGILQFFLDLLRPKIGRFLYFLVMMGVIFFAIELWPFLIGALLIAGVVELFVPLRARFYNKDIVDPTPGNGDDQNQ